MARKKLAPKLGGLKLKGLARKTHGAQGRAPISIKAPHRTHQKITRKRGY